MQAYDGFRGIIQESITKLCKAHYRPNSRLTNSCRASVKLAHSNTIQPSAISLLRRANHATKIVSVGFQRLHGVYSHGAQRRFQAGHDHGGGEHSADGNVG